MQVAVARNVCDGRLVNLHYRGVLAFALIHTHEAVAQILVSPLHDVGLLYLCHAVQSLHFLFPWDAVYEAIHHRADPCLVVIKAVQEVEFEVAEDARHQFLVKFSALYLLYLLQQQGLHLVKSLSFVWRTLHHVHAIVL